MWNFESCCQVSLFTFTNAHSKNIIYVWKNQFAFRQTIVPVGFSILNTNHIRLNPERLFVTVPAGFKNVPPPVATVTVIIFCNTRKLTFSRKFSWKLSSTQITSPRGFWIAKALPLPRTLHLTSFGWIPQAQTFGSFGLFFKPIGQEHWTNSLLLREQSSFEDHPR